MTHFSLLRGDIVIMRYEMCKWEVMKANKHVVLKSEEDVMKILQLVKRRVVNTSNSYLLHYLRRYWHDYDSAANTKEVPDME